MPINRRFGDDPDLIYTVLTGRITDHELLSYYRSLIATKAKGPWRELVDGAQVTEMLLTTTGLKQLADPTEANLEKVRGGRVAMVGSSDVTYGLFRMWELRGESLDYEVRVFRQLEQAWTWLWFDGTPR